MMYLLHDPRVIPDVFLLVFIVIDCNGKRQWQFDFNVIHTLETLEFELFLRSNLWLRTSFAMFALFLCKMRNSVQSQLAGGEKACTASLVKRESWERWESWESWERWELRTRNWAEWQSYAAPLHPPNHLCLASVSAKNGDGPLGHSVIATSSQAPAATTKPF